MRELRIVTANPQILSALYAEGWELKTAYQGEFYLDRETKKTRAAKKAERTPEYQEFHDAYPKKSGITSDRCVRLVAELQVRGRAGSDDALARDDKRGG
jgi:hypothetical protein